MRQIGVAELAGAKLTSFYCTRKLGSALFQCMAGVVP